MAAQGARLWLDRSSVNAAIVDTYTAACEKQYKRVEKTNKSQKNVDLNGWSTAPAGIYKASPVSLAKAIKTAAELEGMQNCHLR